MKTLTIILLGLFGGALQAQTKIDKTIALQSGQTVRMRFDYPQLVKVSTWEKNEISIHGTVTINGGEHDDAFILESNTEGSSVSIRNEIRNMNSLPHRITVVRDGQKMRFQNKSELRKYEEENGKGHSSMSDGIDMDIQLEIRVPRNTETSVEAVYGMVEIKDFTGPLTVEATYGGIDASVIERSTGELIAETNYGHIYSNLDMKSAAGRIRDEDFHTVVDLKPGNGPRYSFESKYGNVYLRKVN